MIEKVFDRNIDRNDWRNIWMIDWMIDWSKEWRIIDWKTEVMTERMIEGKIDRIND
jgi:hypothetical protein